jgi:hypothetical protein
VTKNQDFDVAQQVGSGHFFSTKLSGYHINTYLSRLEHSKKSLGPFEKMSFSLVDLLKVSARCIIF